MDERLPGSFRDPSGFMYERDGVLYRRVAHSYANEYDAAVAAGLYANLSKDGLLVAHDEVPNVDHSAHRTLRPDRIPFISYPYEWSFGELKDAALVTLSIQQKALDAGFVLKDASAYNIQFLEGRPVLIDTLSFERYDQGRPWIAYRQFCQHFLAPLALAAYRDIRLTQLLRANIDGVPLDLAAALMPTRARLHFSMLAHITLHARAQQTYAGSTKPTRDIGTMPRRALVALVSDLSTAIEKLEWKPQGTEWADYYDATNYTDTAESSKRAIVADYLTRMASAGWDPRCVWDVGGNTGVYSRLAADMGMNTVSFDIDPAAVEKNYRTVKRNNERNLLPLVMDLTNPSPALGWAGSERASLEGRGPAGVVMALALVHHLAIGNNVPLDAVAAWFARIGRSLVIEFVPKSDSQVQRLLASRKDIFDSYDERSFETAFSTHFTIEQKTPVEASDRVLYLMRRKS